jgi:hypothetical protein
VENNERTDKLPRKGQILVFTVLVLLVISLAVVSITATATKNARQTFNNLEYEKSYNLAESEVLQAVNKLSNPRLDLSTLVGTGLNELECTAGSDGKFVCGKSVDEGSRRIVISVVETNIVENYDLAIGDYFDIILSQGTNSYRGKIDLRWFGTTAFDISLVYKLPTNKIQLAHEIVDSSGVFTSKGAGFLNNQLQPDGNSVAIDLSNINTSKVPANAILQYLRVKSVSRSEGTSITIRPDTSSPGTLPKQVRRIEAFSYNSETPESAVPVVLTQLPLSPQVPAPLAAALNSDSMRQPICGNNILEGGEICDSTPDCPATCRCPSGGTSVFTTAGGFNGRYDNEITVSSVQQFCPVTAYRYFVITGELDDILVMTKPNENLQWQGDAVTIPKNHIILTPTYGSINGATKFFSVAGNYGSRTGPCNYDNACDIGSFGNGRGWNIFGFGTPIPSYYLKDLGFVTSSIAKFKFTHMAAGAGHALNIQIVGIR